MEWIANRYKMYRNAMDYWRRTLPEGTIVEVSYEDVITDTENQAKRLIEAIGLEWDDACLGFTTMSVQLILQVYGRCGSRSTGLHRRGGSTMRNTSFLSRMTSTNV